MNYDILEIYNETKNISEIDMSFLSNKFLEIKNKILGKDFSLSISLLNNKNSLKINKKQRKQNYIPNTLSFKYTENSGEIIMTPDIIEKEEYEIDNGKIKLINLKDKIIYLMIHSCLHLKDLDHGKKMDELEIKYFKSFVV